MIDPGLVIVVMVGFGSAIIIGLWLVTKWIVRTVMGDVRDT